MSAEPVLLLAWLLVVHLVADFVLQTDRMVAAKNGHGREQLRGLAAHGLGVAACLVPLALAYGPAGLAGLLVIAASHVLIDRAKVALTRRAEARALAAAHRRHAPAGGSVVGMDAAWTPVPAALFALDQLAHALVTGAVWVALLADAPLTGAWTDALAGLTVRWPAADVHRAALLAATGLGLAIVNVRAGSLFVATLVNPRAAVPGPRHVEARADPAAADAATSAAGRAQAAGPAATPPPPEETVAPPARIGEAIGVLERLLIVVLVLSGAEAAIGFVIAAKTLARFRQLDDRAFAEYYLLGTLASASVALASALLARAVLA